MTQNRKTNAELIEDNRRLRARLAQLEDRLDHVAEHGAAARALQQCEMLHRDVMSVVSDAVLIADEAGRLTYVSPNAHFIFGYSPSDLVRQGRLSSVLPSDFFDPDLLEQRGEIANIECQIRDAVGRTHSLLVTARRIDRHGGTVLVVCRDISDCKRIELDYQLLSLTLEQRVADRTRTLRESRERYRRLVEGLRDEYLFYATNSVGTITYISPSIHTILGYAPNQVIGRNWREFVEPNSPVLAELEKLERMRFAGLSTPPFSASLIHASGELRVLEFSDAPVRDPDGHVIASEGIGRDMTHRHRAEEALRRAHDELEQRVRERTAELTAMYERLRDSEHRYRSIVEDHLEFIIRWRDEGVRTFVNESYCRNRNATPEALLGSAFLTELFEEDRNELQRKLAEITVDNPVVVHEHRVSTPEGRTVWEHWSHRALYNQQGELIEFQSMGRDVTERRKREEQAKERSAALALSQQLSDREHEVMRLVVAGDANKIIARKLGLSIKTIEKHRSSLMKKLQVRGIPELVRLALLIESSSTEAR